MKLELYSKNLMNGISKTVAIMKKLMKLFVLVAAAAMALASCQKNEITGPETQEVHFTIKADIAETKTYITDKGDKTYLPSWSKEDKIGVLFALEENAKAEDFENTAEAGEEATFEGKHAFTVVEGASEVDGYLYAFYPSSAFKKVYSDGGVRLDLITPQYPTSTSFDPECDLLIAKPCHYMAEATGEQTDVVIDDMYFARMMSVLRINLNSEFLSNETVKSVSFDADGVDFTGAMKFNLATGEFVGNQSTSQDLSEVKAVYSAEDPIYVAGEKNSAYLVLAPVTIPSGTTLTFTIETENYDIVKTITAKADMVMPAGNVAVINLSIAEENCTAKVEDTSDYSGEWLIVNSDLTRAAKAWADGRNNLPEFVLTINEGVVLESDGIANCKMIITKEAEGYTIQDASGKYLYAAGGTADNHLKGKTEKSYWTIEKGETNYVITSLAQNTRNILRYNSSSKIFSCYSSGQADVTLYKYSDIKPDTNPSVSVTETTSQSIGAEGGDLTFTCTTKNLDGETLEVVEESEFLTWSVAENVVTITVAANEAEESRTLNATIKCGSVEVPVTINQAAAGSAESGWISKSFADLKTGDQVVIVATKESESWALSDANGTSKAPSAVTITYSGDKLTSNPADEIIWYVGGDASGRVFYADAANGTKWLYCTSTNNGVRVGDNDANTFVLDKASGYLKHVGTSRYVGVYTTTPDWRCYTNTTGNTAGQTFKFFVKSGDGGVVTPDPEEPENPTPDVPENPSTGESKTATITFGSNDVKINSDSVTATDTQNNTWTITTKGTTSYTANSAYYQVGSSSKPATSITFTTTLPSGVSVSKVSAKFGGFSGTAGNVTLKVNETSIGTGKLNATSDVTVMSTSTASGNIVTVAVTNIAKGVKCYNISVEYTE